MPASKRKQRRKAAEMQETSDIDMPDSSPTRPSAKKRKVNDSVSTTHRKSLSRTSEPILPNDETDEESEVVSQSDLIDSVVSYLQVSKEPVMAVQEYANEKEHADASQKVSAYAKIAGRDWTYFVRDQSVNIGRPPDDRPAINGVGASSPIQDLKEVLPVHIDLGPSKIVSRHHASIFYDADYPPEEGGWHVRVNGRNGVRVNNVLIKRGGRQQIKSGAILEIAGTQMMFVTPGDKVQIDQYFIDRAKALATGEEFMMPLSHSHPEPELDLASATAFPPMSGYQSLAPAPPNFKRTTTPPPQGFDGRGQRGMFDSKSAMSPMYGRGMMMESTQEIDYSRDSAKDLKPPYSYATMIAQAIFSSDEEKLTLSNIYSFIADKYAFYRHSNSGWQNSIRHNLSLNKAFQKVPRRTDEPGKGMKWQIAPEYRQEYWKKQARRAGGSAPSSPASSKDVNPNFRGPNGQNLGYDTTMVTQFSAKDVSDRPVPPHPAKMNLTVQTSIPFPPHSGGPYPPGPTLAPPAQVHELNTPQRKRTDTQNTLPDPNEFDDSPFPHAHRQDSRSNNIMQIYSLPPSAPQLQHSPTNPTLSSSYLDTPFHPSRNTMVTPAPLRQNPRLAPPSTLVAPSKFMPESSPAGPGLFWKGLMGVTPGQPLPDMSPVKEEDRRNPGLDRNVLSSSPPPMDGALSGSPSKAARSSSQLPQFSSSFKREESRTSNGYIDETIAPHSSSSMPLPPSSQISQVPIHPTNHSHPLPAAQIQMTHLPPLPPSQQQSNGNIPSTNAASLASAQSLLNMHMGMGLNNGSRSHHPHHHHDGVIVEEETDDGDGGFDLAKGFAPIGSFHSTHSTQQRSGSVNAAR